MQNLNHRSQTQGTFALTRRLLRDSRPHGLLLTLFTILSLVAMPIAILIPFPIKLVVDNVIGNRELPTLLSDFANTLHASALTLACGLALTVTLLQTLQTLAAWIFQRYIGERMVSSMRARVLDRIQFLPALQIAEFGTPDLLYRLQNDVLSMQYFAISGFIPFVASAFTFLVMFYVTFSFDPTLAWLALTVIPLLWILGRWHSQRSRQSWNQVKETERAAIGTLQETLNCLPVVKAFGQEARQTEKFLSNSDLSLNQYLKALGTDSIFGLIVALAIASATTISIYIGVGHVRNGLLSLGSFLIVMAYLAQLLKSIETLSKQAAAAQSSLASAERVYALLDLRSNLKTHEPHVDFNRARGRVAFKSVSFSYRESFAPALDQVDFEIPAGARVGLIGPTGAGKTTLLRLLTRAMDPDAGSIQMDGVDIRNIPAGDFRKQFAMVLQEPVLFADTIAANITFGRPFAKQAEMIAAARSAGIHDFIMSLPEGYETQIGERGATLSGGERQRISIARAFLMDAPLLILDEPTSALDDANASAISEALQKLADGRTAFVISHRETFLSGFDYVFEVRDGIVRRIFPPPLSGTRPLTGPPHFPLRPQGDLIDAPTFA